MADFNNYQNRMAQTRAQSGAMIDEGLRAYMLKVYNLMALALVITGVAAFGFFATVEGVGGDGLVPARDLGREYFRYDESSQQLVGEDTGEAFALGQRLKLRLVEANPVSGALRFELPDGKGSGSGEGAGDRRRGSPPRVLKRRGRPANIRHQGKRR